MIGPLYSKTHWQMIAKMVLFEDHIGPTYEQLPKEWPIFALSRLMNCLE